MTKEPPRGIEFSVLDSKFKETKDQIVKIKSEVCKLVEDPKKKDDTNQSNDRHSSRGRKHKNSAEKYKM